MTDQLKRHEATISKKHHFGWTPSHQEEFRTSLSKTVFIPIVIRAFEQLGWDLVFQNEATAEAKRQNSWKNWTEKITVTFNYGKAMVKSESLGNELWDNGRNSKRTGLFIYAFQQQEKEMDNAAVAKLEQEIEKANNWDDYVIPETLPSPKKREDPKPWIVIAGGIVTALVLGLVLAFLSNLGLYFIGAFEFLVALAIGFSLKGLISLSRFTNYDKLHYLLIGMIILTYVSNQYFQYQIILTENNYDDIGFFTFMKLRLEAGLNLETINTGWIGLLISWALQLGITYFVGVYRLALDLTTYQLKMVPMEVVDFAAYHIIKEKTDEQVRTELAQMGWTDRLDQDNVFNSLEAIHGAMEISRIN